MAFEDNAHRSRRGGGRLRRILADRRSAVVFTAFALVGTLALLALFSGGGSSEAFYVVRFVGAILVIAGLSRIAWSFIQAWFERSFSPEVKQLVRIANLVLLVLIFFWVVY